MASNRYRACELLIAVALATPLAATDRTVSVEAVEVSWTTGSHRYDGAGNIMQIGPNHLHQTDTYRYDQAGRLASATAHTPVYVNEQTFRYDAFGNLLRLESTSERDGAAPITSNTIVAVDPETNRMHAAPCAGINDGSCVFGTYDHAGNQTWSSAGVQYEFDVLGMMVLLRSGGGEQQYVYDANNERIATITPLDGRYTLRDLGGKVVRELKYDGLGWTWQKDYVYRDGFLLAAILPDGRHHFHLDHLGTPRLVTDDRGMTVAAHTYWPFGAEAQGSEIQPSERMKFTGHERDFGPGRAQDLDYMHARYYNPNAGRFLSVDPGRDWDPSKPQTWNLYSYARNNPLLYTDPDGRAVKIEIKRDTYTAETVTGTIKVTSDVKDAGTFDGFTLEDTKAGAKGDKDPIAPGTYDAFVRDDHDPKRVELKDVAGFTNVQIHVGNTKEDVMGCFAVGEKRSADKVESSKDAMKSILAIIDNDKSGVITVTVEGPSTKPRETELKKEKN